MAQQVAKARVSIPSVSPHVDGVSFDFTFEATGSNPNLDWASPTNPTFAIEQFFTNVGTQHYSLQSYLGVAMSRGTNACQINWTDVTAHLNGSPAGGPFRTDTFTLNVPLSASDLPGANCVAVGYRANYGTAIEKGPLASLPTPDDAIDYGAPATHMGQTRPRARMRSRLYFGPVVNAGPAVALTDGLVGNNLHDDLGNAMTSLLITWNSGLANQFNLVVWSRRDAAVYTAKNYFVNEAFAVQSRRSDPSALRVHNWVNVP